MHCDETVKLFAKLFQQIGPNWKSFINTLKKKAN